MMLDPIGKSLMTVDLFVCTHSHTLVLKPSSNSNGSGKSSLAMAALWALTGSMDPRRALDGKVSDVINDDCKVGCTSGAVYCVVPSLTQHLPLGGSSHLGWKIERRTLYDFKNQDCDEKWPRLSFGWG